MNRRDFLRSATAASAALAGGARVGSAQGADSTSQPSGQLPRRPYGQEKIMVSIVGFPGIALDHMPQDQADRAVAYAVERGLNYFDVAPSYGNAQKILGKALQPYRSRSFLACKTTKRGREDAELEMKGSLEALKTDYFDLYQLHAIKDVKKDVDAVFAKGGTMEMLIEARKAGVIRHIGFSAHSVEAALAAMDRYAFDSAMFPVNFASWSKHDFGPQIMKAARGKGVTCIALKGMARQVWPKGDPEKKKFAHCWYQPLTDPHEASLGLRWALSQPITVAIGPGDVSLLPLMMDIATRFRPIEADEVKKLTEIARDWHSVFPMA